MKKSLLALILAIIMCLSLFATGCASTDGDEDKDVMKTETNAGALTLTLYAPTNASTTQKEIDAVQAAFNVITQAKFNTNVVLKLIPEDEYEATIADTLAAAEQQLADEEAAEQSRLEAERQEALLGKDDKDDKDEKETEAPEEQSSPEQKYPAAKENQIDIFMVNSFETYQQLALDLKLAALDEHIAEGSKLLNSYIYPYLLRAAKVDGSTYGIFNNTIFGGYQYLLLNKELVDKYEYDPEKIKDVESISMFLEEVKQKEAEVIPFLGEMEAPVVYWDDQESLIGSFVGSSMSGAGTVDATSSRPQATRPANLLNTSAYRDWITAYNELYQAGCIVEKTEANANSKFAATIIDGDVTLSPTYAKTYGNYKTDEFGFKYITDENGVDYYVSVYRRPMANNENVFNAGYVVSSYTDPDNVARCMQIITALNTDAELANTFMYGVKDVHYTIDELTNMVHKTTDAYSMDIQNVGNIYLLNPSDDMDEYWSFMSANKWENAKNTNREAVMSPLLGYYFDPEKPAEEDIREDQINLDLTFDEVYTEVVNISKTYLNELKTSKSTPTTDLAKYIQSARAVLGADEHFETMLDYDRGLYCVFSNYVEWYEGHYGVTVE